MRKTLLATLALAALLTAGVLSHGLLFAEAPQQAVAGGTLMVDGPVAQSQMASNCSNMAPFTAYSTWQCADLCFARGCGIDLFESRTNCCFCGDQF